MCAKILAFLGLGGCAPWGVKEERMSIVEVKDELAVLFIGNSYSFDVPREFKKHAAERGKRVRVGRSAYGGWHLHQHVAHDGTLKKLRDGKWDVVVLQDHSLSPVKPESERRKEMDPAIQFFVEQAHKTGAVPILYQTWGRRDGQPGVKGDDFFKMNDRVRRGYARAAKNAGGVLVAKVGDAWEEEFRAGRGADLFEEDGSHPSVFGNKVTARVFYETIFRE